jgi:hypothetical protein
MVDASISSLNVTEKLEDIGRDGEGDGVIAALGAAKAAPEQNISKSSAGSQTLKRFCILGELPERQPLVRL